MIPKATTATAPLHLLSVLNPNIEINLTSHFPLNHYFNFTISTDSVC